MFKPVNVGINYSSMEKFEKYIFLYYYKVIKDMVKIKSLIRKEKIGGTAQARGYILEERHA